MYFSPSCYVPAPWWRPLHFGCFQSCRFSASSKQENQRNLVTDMDLSWSLRAAERISSQPSLSVPLLYHSMGQIIKSVFFCLCMYVCMYVCICGHDYGRIIQPIVTKLGKNLWGLNRKNWLGWGRNPKMPSPILARKTKIWVAWIGISSQICKNFKSSYLQNYTSD